MDDDGTDEMGGYGAILARAQDILPKLAAFLLDPGVIPLIDWNDEPRRFFDEFKNFRLRGFHDSPIDRVYKQDY